MKLSIISRGEPGWISTPREPKRDVEYLCGSDCDFFMWTCMTEKNMLDKKWNKEKI